MQRDRRSAGRTAEHRAVNREVGRAAPALAHNHFGRTKTSDGEQDDFGYITGRAVEAPWMAGAKIDKESVFRGIRRWGTLSRRALDPQSINVIIGSGSR